MSTHFTTSVPSAAGQGVCTYTQACIDFCEFVDSLIVMNTQAMKQRKPFDDPHKFLDALEVMQCFMAYKGLHSSCGECKA
jgi:hypothetical protein